MTLQNIISACLRTIICDIKSEPLKTFSRSTILRTFKMGSLLFLSFVTLLLVNFGSSQSSYCRSGNYGNASSNKTYNVVGAYKNDAIKQVIRSASAFSGKFIKEIGKNSSFSVISSPYSVSMIMSMLAQGAKDKTFTEMHDVLELPSDDWLTLIGYQSLNDLLSKYNQAELRVVSKIFLPCHARPKSVFTDKSTAASRSLLTSVDFKTPSFASSIINKWCQKETYGFVNDIVKPEYFCPHTSIVLVSAAYFKGTWAHPFSSTTVHFRNTHGVKTLPAMRAINTYNYGTLPSIFDATFVEIPFAEYGLSMIVILPRSNQWSKADEGLRRLENNLDKINVKEIIETGRRTRVEVVLPKIIIRTKVDLTGTLKRLNFNEMSTNPNFNGIADVPLRISKFIHSGFIELNEVGPNPALASGATCNSQEFNTPVPFTADHPFIALIVARHNDNPFTVLAARFAGYR